MLFKLRTIGDRRVIYIIFILLILDFVFQLCHNLVEYKNYPITIFERKFGYYDEKENCQILRGNENDAFQFFEIITNSEDGWIEISNSHGKITKFKIEDKVYCTLEIPLDGKHKETNIIISSKNEIWYPFSSNQKIIFKETD